VTFCAVEKTMRPAPHGFFVWYYYLFLGKLITKTMPVHLTLRVDWSELDYFRHVNNVSFFKYIQSARVNYWDQIGLTLMHQQTNVGPMLASCQCHFKAPLFYPSTIQIVTQCHTIGNTSFGFTHRIFNEQEQLAAEAQDVMVMFDFNKNLKVPFPEELRRKIEALEGNKSMFGQRFPPDQV
jgi:acyl-CoA thioester hydrolase